VQRPAVPALGDLAVRIRGFRAGGFCQNQDECVEVAMLLDAPETRLDEIDRAQLARSNPRRKHVQVEVRLSLRRHPGPTRFAKHSLPPPG
jgi:hypothetical protein